MVVDIMRVGDRKTTWPDHSKITFEDLKYYTLTAKKLISSEAQKIKPGLAKEMLEDEDAISLCIQAVIHADWQWDGVVGNKFGYRKQRVIWVIKNYLSRQASIKQKQIASLNMKLGSGENRDILLSDVVPCKQQTPLTELVQNEQLETVNKLMKGLTPQQNRFIEMHYLSSMSMSDIGRQEGCTRQNVKQVIDSALETLRKAACQSSMT